MRECESTGKERPEIRAESAVDDFWKMVNILNVVNVMNVVNVILDAECEHSKRSY